MIVTFCGHDNVSDLNKVRDWLSQVLDQFISEENITFYLGGYGGFDRLAASVVQQKKKLNSKAQSILVLSYLNRQYDDTSYDNTVFPPLESVPPRYAISKRNEWMVSQADVVVAYVTQGWGGAAKTFDN